MATGEFCEVQGVCRLACMVVVVVLVFFINNAGNALARRIWRE